MDTCASTVALNMYSNPQDEAMASMSQAPKPKAVRSGSNENISNSSNGVTKPKQSKSRNGCITCKAKRLKCDEGKPSCSVCAKRGVTCGGYKKDFKWRAFEEVNMGTKPSKPKTKVPSPITVKEHKRSQSSLCPSPALSDASFSPMNSPMPFSSLEYLDTPSPQTPEFFPYSYSVPPGRAVNANVYNLEDSYTIPRGPYSPPDGQLPRSHPPFMNDYEQQNMASISPRLQDLLLPGSDLNRHTPIPEFVDYPSTPRELDYDPIIDDTMQYSPQSSDFVALSDDAVEEVVRSINPLPSGEWQLTNYGLKSSNNIGINFGEYGSLGDIFRRPAVTAHSDEILMSHFDKHTCGIMSIKDGPNENPWRTLIWPLAKDTPALYHAIASMTAFHMCKDRPALRVDGMEHMRQSIVALASGLGTGTMKVDAALATTIVLAFAEQWDRHISTGIEHLRGAKIFVNQAITRHRSTPLQGSALARLNFLYNVYIYLDVLAKLTSDSDDDTIMMPPSGNGPPTAVAEIDPLMGCATTLFPLIGQCATLVRQVRNSKKNTLGIVSQALDLKTKIEEWTPDSYFEPPEDHTLDVACCLKTAEAYRYATLLYLHQAVPELPSPTSSELANKVMILLASIPPSSRASIVHIYPLLAAGCEATGLEERDWVKKRWKELENRMWIGNVDRGWEVIQEVWHRRDQFQQEREQAASIAAYHSHVVSRACTPSDELDDYSLGGQQALHHSYHIPPRRHMSAENVTPFLEVDMPWGFQQTSINHNNTSSPSSTMSFANASNSTRRRAVSDSLSAMPKLLSSASLPEGSTMFHESNGGELIPEMTIRGRLHWVSVMKEWKWEVLLG